MRARACVRQHVRACVLFVLSIVVVMIGMVTTMIWWSLPYSLNWMTRANPGVLVDLVFVGGNLRRAQGANACPGGRGGAQSADACPGGPLKVQIRVPAGALKVQIRVPVGGLKVQIRVPVGALKVPIRVPVGVPQSANTCPGKVPSSCQYGPGGVPKVSSFGPD